VAGLLEAAVVEGLAIPKREAWVLAGFVPPSDDERRRPEACRQGLGFDPTIEAHRLTVGPHGANESAEDVLDALTGGQLEREAWRHKGTALSTLVGRGASSGLAAFVGEIEERSYHRFGSGKTWIEEYGSADDAEDFKALYAYSPYHHVTAGTKYPATLILSADSDDRVDPMHARKFAAMMQAASAGGPVLLRVEKHSGHGGADLVRSTVERMADEFAFALDQTKD
jgi:hypothetical protein